MELLVSLLFLITNALAGDTILSHSFFDAYKECNISKNMLYLSKVQRKEVEKSIGTSSVPGVVKTYSITCGKQNKKVFLLSDLIRTHYQKGFVSVGSGTVSRIEIVHFKEPEKYRAPISFIKRLSGKSSFEDVDGLTGATLTRSSLIRMSKLAIELSKVK